MRHFRLELRAVAAVAATALWASCAPTESGDSGAADVTVFEGARLLVGDGTVIEEAAFAVEGGRFTLVGPRGAVTVPAGALHVDLTGKTVMPAIVNTHVHLASAREERLAQLEHMAYYGAAAAVSLGQDQGEAPFAMRDEVLVGAARSLTAGRGITSPEPGRSEAPHWVTSESEARAAVRELAAQRVDLVKIWVDDRNGQYEKLSPGLYSAVIEEAHTHGLRVTAHVYSLDDAKALLLAGVDAFAHGVRDREVDEALLAMWGERPGVVLVPNLPDPGVRVDLSWITTVPAGELAEMQERSTDRPDAQRAFAIQAANLAALHEAGVPIAFGTDGSTPWAPHLEMEDMVRSGMSPADVILAATLSSAHLVGLESELGSVTPGKSADFIVLDADPLEDITNTRRIADVYLRGEALDREGLRARILGMAAP
jgi:imidazolonepropionase-like amidohydrolase